MSAKVLHFKVGNGDMTLFEFEDGRTLLADIDIREGADDPAINDWADVAAQLRGRLKRDGHGRLYVDAFLLTHPDADHVRGLQRHFHLGPAGEWSRADDKILIGEQWSSPIVFRRKSKDHVLCADAVAWATEARRRVARHRMFRFGEAGELIKILGEDVDGKTDDIQAIVVQVDTEFNTIAGAIGAFRARLIAPLPADDEDEEDVLSKNDSSVILTLCLRADGVDSACRYLLGGDAGVAVWERVWERHADTPSVLSYHVLLSPHHCSWHSLSWDSWSDLKEDARVSEGARAALGQPLPAATIISSSNKVVDDEYDPPCVRARREYVEIAKGVTGTFLCLADHGGDGPYVIEVTRGGPRPERPKSSGGSSGIIGAAPLPHG